MSHAGFWVALELKGAPKGCPTMVLAPFSGVIFRAKVVFFVVTFLVFFWTQLLRLMASILAHVLMHVEVILVTFVKETDLNN